MFKVHDTSDQRGRGTSLLDAAILASLFATITVTVFAWMQQI